MTASIYDIPVRKITGDDASLGRVQRQSLLVVNVASKCGLTPQYEALEKTLRAIQGAGPRCRRLSREQLQKPGAGHRRRDSDLLHRQLRREVSHV